MEMLPKHADPSTVAVDIINNDELENLCNPDVPIGDAIKVLKSNVTLGLSTEEAAKRLNDYGLNELEKKGRMPLYLLFLSQFANLIIIILMVAAVVSIIVGELVEGVAVVVIIIITVSLSTATEYSSGNALEALAQLTDPHTHVYRDGSLQVIRTPEVVPGDIIELSPGDLVPADVRLITAHSVKVNEMILTGESTDVTKKENVAGAESGNKLTNVNMVYSSTSVVEGRLKGVVIFTGMNTRVGSIASLISAAGQQQQASAAAASPQARARSGSMSQEQTRMVRAMSFSHEYEAPAADSDDECDDADDSGESKALVSHEEPEELSCFGRLVQHIEGLKAKKTPLQESLHRLGLLMTAFALTGATLVVFIGIYRGFRVPSKHDSMDVVNVVNILICMIITIVA